MENTCCKHPSLNDKYPKKKLPFYVRAGRDHIVIAFNHTPRVHFRFCLHHRSSIVSIEKAAKKIKKRVLCKLKYMRGEQQKCVVRGPGNRIKFMKNGLCVIIIFTSAVIIFHSAHQRYSGAMAQCCFACNWLFVSALINNTWTKRLSFIISNTFRSMPPTMKAFFMKIRFVCEHWEKNCIRHNIAILVATN